MNQMTIQANGVEIGSSAPYFWITPYTGLGEPETRINILNNSGASGGYLAGRPLFAPRQIPVTVKILTNCPNEHIEARQKIAEAFPFGVLQDVTITNESGQAFRVTAMRTNNLDLSITGMIESDLTIELVAPDPLVYSFTNGNINSADVLPEKAGGLEWGTKGLSWTNNGLPWTNGSAPVTITNNGTDDVYPIVVIEGESNNPGILHKNSNKKVQFNIDTDSTDVIWIDMRKKVALLNPQINEKTKEAVSGTGTNLRNNMSDTGWWSLAPGSNPVRLIGDGKATVYWLDAYRRIV